MKELPFSLLLAALIVVGCEPAGTEIKGTASQPIFKSWVVPFPSAGRVISVLGSAWKLDNSRKKYVELHSEAFLVPGDLLQLKRNSRVVVEFEDHSTLIINPRDYPVPDSGEDIYFTIEKRKSSNNASSADS
jgi:hypothetical protein